jgi:genome maintenance exonuclease 1
MIKINNKYNYTQFSREDSDNGRLYLVNETKLPSVTTILSKTKPAESVKKLNEWKQRVGIQEAKKITKEASDVGTLVHNILEAWILNKEFPIGNNLIHKQAKNMADIIKKNIENDITEVWGSEVSLYYPDLYAGTSDLIGLWKNVPTIMDFKQTNKPKQREWIGDYFLQLAAYAEAHNVLYDTDINQGVVFMCSREGEFQKFEVSGAEFEYWKNEWANRINKYYNISEI